jgi:hypothetical protein
MIRIHEYVHEVADRGVADKRELRVGAHERRDADNFALTAGQEHGLEVATELLDPRA